jgi:hypothetical protein
MPVETLSPLEDLVATLLYCQNAEDLMAIAAGYSSQVLEEAIALQPNLLRQQLGEWFAQLSQSQMSSGGELAQPAQPEAGELTPIEMLIRLFESCQSEPEFTELSKFYEVPERRSPVEKQELLETAILYSRLEIRGKLQRWWDFSLRQIRDFWQFLWEQESLLVGGSANNVIFCLSLRSLLDSSITLISDVDVGSCRARKAFG